MISLKRFATIWKIRGVRSSFGGRALTFYGNLNSLRTFLIEAKFNLNLTFLEVYWWKYAAFHQNDFITFGKRRDDLVLYLPVYVVFCLWQLK